MTQPRRLSGSFEYLLGINLGNLTGNINACCDMQSVELYWIDKSVTYNKVYCDIVSEIPCIIVFGVN
jgi:hypothetical protein